MDDTIKTIKQEHTIENIISKSRFIAHIKPVESEDEAKILLQLSKQNIKKLIITVRHTQLVIK